MEVARLAHPPLSLQSGVGLSWLCMLSSFLKPTCASAQGESRNKVKYYQPGILTLSPVCSHPPQKGGMIAYGEDWSTSLLHRVRWHSLSPPLRSPSPLNVRHNKSQM